MVHCGATCGEYSIDRLLDMSFRRPHFEDADLVPYLSAYIKQHTKPGALIDITKENWKALAEGIRSTPVGTKVEKLLRLIADRSYYPGEFILDIDGNGEYPLADAANIEELTFILEHLQEIGLIAWTRKDSPAFVFNAKVLPKGWERLQANPKTGVPGRCFVAMSFDDTLQDAYSLAIEPALRSCGLDPRRVDKILDNRDINEKIISELRDAEMVVADFTLQRNGVYFEAGFARGLGREVFWTCREDDLANLHFDTRQFSFIVWNDLLDLKQQLTDKIKALGFARN